MLAVALAVASLAAQQPPPASTGTGTIVGQVIDSETRQPVPGASVLLLGRRVLASGAITAPPQRSPINADSQGRFAFTGLAAGTYIAETVLAGYASLGVVSSRPVELPDAGVVSDVKLQLAKLAIISGTVRDDAGDPVVGVEVFAFQRVSLQGRPPVLANNGRSRTDDRGQYRFSGLRPAEYYVCACSREPIPFDGQLLTTLAARPLELLGVAGRAAKAGADAASLDNTLRTFTPTFHPNTPLAGRAERVRASGAEPKTGIDIAVTAVRSVRVSGRVVGVPGTGLSANAVRLTPSGDIPEAVAITQIVPMLVQPDGRFDFAGVPPGQYTLDVRTGPGTTASGPSGAALAFIGNRGAGMGGTRGGGPPADPLWASQVISVGEENVTGLIVSLQPGATITGRLDFSGTAPPPPPGPQTTARANAVQLNSIDPPPRSLTYSAAVTADGTFRIAVIPGRYVVFPLINAPGWPSLKSVTLGGVDITDTIVDIGSADLNNMVVTVTDVPMAELRGTVAGAVGSQDQDTYVRMFPAERRFWEEPFGAFARFKSMRVEKNTFTIPRIPAGEYYIVVVNDGGLEWMDKAQLDAMARTAERVRFVDGEKKVLEIRR